MEPPRVALVSLSAPTLSNLEALFSVKLRITNPNSIPLPLKGMNYSLALNNYSVFQGVSNNLPTIAAYGEEVVELSVSTNLLSAPKFLLDLASKPDQAINYNFSSKVDLKGALPSFNIKESGEITGS